MPPHFFHIVPGVGRHLVVAKPVADVSGVGKRHPVGDAPLGGCTGEPVGVADDPVGHKAAVAAAGNSHAGGVDGRVFGDDRIGELHQVVVVIGAIGASQFSEGFAPAVASPGIHKEDKVSHAGPSLHLMEEDGAKGSLGTAVDVDNRRVLLTGVITVGRDDPALQGDAVVLKEAGLRGGDGVGWVY